MTRTRQRRGATRVSFWLTTTNGHNQERLGGTKVRIWLTTTNGHSRESWGGTKVYLAGGQNSSGSRKGSAGTSPKGSWAVVTFRNLAGGQNHSGSRKRIGETYIHISLYTYIPSIFWGKILIYLMLMPYRTYIHYTIYIVIYNSTLEENAIYII